MSTSAQMILDYAPHPRRRRWVRTSAIIAAIAAASFVIQKYREAVWQHAQQLYWQHECMNYSPPANQVDYYNYGAPNQPLLVGIDPTPLTEFLKLNPSFADPWAGSLMFMGQLRATSGKRYLVSIGWTRMGSGLYDWIFPLESYSRVSCHVFAPGTWTTAPVELPSYVSWNKFEPETSSPQLRIFTGQIDPSDDSHFTISYDFNGKPDIIDGTLDDQVNVGTSYPNICLKLASRYAAVVVEPPQDEN